MACENCPKLKWEIKQIYDESFKFDNGTQSAEGQAIMQEKLEYVMKRHSIFFKSRFKGK